MRKLLIAFALLFVTGCATNGGPFDAHFWVKPANEAVVKVVDEVVEVKDKVVVEVKDVVDVVTTPEDKQKGRHKKK